MTAPMISVLVAVDVQAALAQIAKDSSNTNVGSFVYMMDTTGYSGSGEGTNELCTTVTVGDMLQWSVSPIDPATSVEISSFTGAAIGTNAQAGEIINPAPFPQYNPTGSVWGGSVNATSPKVQYSITLSLDGVTSGWFDPFIISNAPQ